VPNWEAIESGESSGTHWFDEVYQKNAPVQSHSVNITSGNQVSTFAFGFSHLSQKGIIGKQTNNEYQRTNLRFNSEHILLKKANQNILTFGENLNYSNTQKPTIRTGNIYWNDLHNMIVTSPLLPMYAEDKSDLAYPYHYATRWNGFEANPVASMIYNTKYETNQNSSIVANIYAEFEPLKNLKFRSSFGINTWFGSSRKWVPVYNLNEQSVTYNDRVTQSMWLGYTNTLTNTLAYSFKLKEKNNFSVILGQEATKNRINQSLSNSNDSTRFNDYEYAYISNTDITNIANINMSGRDDFGWGMLSYFGRVSYDYKETILATVILRSDGSSNFAEGHRWGTFPSVSLGYILSNAPFIKNLRGLDYLKLRGSWGQNGNQDITKYQYLATLSTQSSNYTFGTDRSQYSVGYFPARIPNPNVTWETSEQTSLGFDAQFLKNRLVVNFDVYNKITKDWLVVAPQLATNGTDAPFINGGTISNKGFELVLGWKDNIGDFKYGTSFSLAKNKNEVTDIANNEKIIHGPSGVLLAGMSELFRAQVGYPIGYFWGYETNGLIQNATDSADYVRYFKDIRPGDIRFVDQNNDSIIDKLDKVMLGDPNPDYIFGFQLSAEYKGFYMEVTANGLAGNQIAKAYRSGGAKANFTEYDLGRWHGEGTSNKLPRIDAQVHPRNDLWVSNRFIEDADFLRISNLTIGYDLNSLFAKSPIRQARIYFTAKNLYTFTNYSGMDPEVGYGPDGYSWASGIDLGLYPSARTYMVGISVKF
jgi:TonB-linked SusC/RagA family outer membrane protein